MTATIEETDLELIEALDFDPAIPCCGKQGKCEEEAVWKGTLSCCGYTDFFCDYCRQLVEFFLHTIGMKHNGTPEACGHVIRNMMWEPL